MRCWLRCHLFGVALSAKGRLKPNLPFVEKSELPVPEALPGRDNRRTVVR